MAKLSLDVKTWRAYIEPLTVAEIGQLIVLISEVLAEREAKP